MKMKQLLSFTRAAQIATVLFGIGIVFHIVIVAGILLFDFAPMDRLWGGRLRTTEELLTFELIAIVVTSLCLFAVLIRTGHLNFPRLVRASAIALWILFILFLLNTVGNVFAPTTVEKLFSIVTVILTLACLRLALGNTRENPGN